MLFVILGGNGRDNVRTRKHVQNTFFTRISSIAGDICQSREIIFGYLADEILVEPKIYFGVGACTYAALWYKEKKK